MSARKMEKNVTEAVDRTTNQPSKVDEDELFAQIGVKIDDPKSKSKTSFYITRFTQVFLRLTSDAYGLPQGDIVNYATPLFAKIAQLSLNRREKSLATLRTLNDQIQSSIEAMKTIAPHLSDLLRDPAEMISGLIDLEEQAVKAKVIEGLGIKHETAQNDVPFPLYMIFCGDEPYES
jgi:hypothetical protein